ncbi:MAG: type I restriction enzyme HsdR N-terminal domain-containing protein [Proteobacteria bacterium]|nr:type I restriction enzyme HsdR N-terminal domain-containing protein [Pseudomonadota bacterium]
MYKIGTRARTRMSNGLRRLLPIIKSARNRDVNEADTVTIVTDILEEIFGYNKYLEITAEHKIRRSYCDLAITINDHIPFLVEVKAIGCELKEQHTKQVVEYSAQEGIKWAVLTNGAQWHIYKVNLKETMKCQLISSFDITTLTPNQEDTFVTLYPLSCEGVKKNAFSTLNNHYKVMNQYSVAALLLSPPVLNCLRRETKKIFKEIATDSATTTVLNEDIYTLLINKVLKRAITESDELEVAKNFLSRTYRKIEKHKKKNQPKKNQPPTTNSSAKIVDLDIHWPNSA